MYTTETELEQYASDVHKGHRRRMLERFVEFGFEGLAEHEILEMLLFYSVPRKNTNPIAHALINRFGSLNAVFDAEISDLKAMGLSDNSAVFMKMIPQLANIYAVHSSKCTVLDTTAKAREFFYNRYIGVKNEQIRVACLDSSMSVISCEVVAQGELDRVDIQPRKIIEIVLKNKSSNIFLAHNHPNAEAAASNEDIISTRNLNNILKTLDINLLDHIIVGGKNTLSMKESGYFSIFDM